ACIDRVEEGLLVCYTDDDACYVLSADENCLYKGGERVLLTLEDNTPVSLEYLEKETKEAERRVRSLFAKLLTKKKGQ
ncbi:MAG: hypothetical protein J6R40_06035, partial [Clostridia bacterium]|nr:hypothetical protein [Clostridia bacterium]